MRQRAARIPRPPRRGDEPTLKAKDDASAAARLSPAQRRVLVALGRPLADKPHGVQATNKEIAAELCISVDAVRTQLRRAAEVLGVDRLSQNEKRTTLAWTAIAAGGNTARDLAADG